MIEQAHVDAVCRPATETCCRYLVMSPDGWDCCKLNPTLKAYIDERVVLGAFRAVGDNCEGQPH